MKVTIALAAVSVLSMFSCQPEPAEIRVASISLSNSTLELTVGDQASLDATISPDNATNKEISWASDNEAVVTVSSAGVVKALRAGTASITATTVDQGKTASCAVTVAEKMGAVTGEATHISCRNAKLSGKVTLSQTTATNLSFGVLYSTSSVVLLGSATQLEAKEFDADYNFTIDSGVLEPETTYYYRSYIIQNDKVEYGDTKSFKTLALSSMIQTLDASGVNPKDATLNAMLDLTDCKYNNIEYGFELTPEGGQAKTLTANNLADKAFSYRDETLIKNTKYSYSAYVILDGILYKAEPKTFKTASIQASVNAAASDIQYYSATISGSLTVQSEGSFSKSAVLYYSKTENTVEGLKSKGIKKTLTLGVDGSYSETLSSLPSSTSYNFVVVAKVDDVELVTEVKSFKTLKHPYELTYDLNISSATDLSSAASANCYIISEAGLYKFKTVKGNSTTSVGSVASASILWETFGTDTAPELLDLISGFCYKDGYIAFQTADTFKEGNAVI
ncbi:MAG: Ig-like domain-containing protein, partial [Candidatus Cryptobacteroides sp.]|nr:Ig-like domain-containing protein [Candidatus Cryptobacteroides sp.]